MSVFSTCLRHGLILAIALSSFVGMGETTVGLGSGGEKKREKAAEYSNDKGAEKSDKTERTKSREISIEDSTTERDGNYSKTDSVEINAGKDKKTTTDNNSGKKEESNSYKVGYDKSTEHKVEGKAGDENLHGEADARVKYGHEVEASYGDDGLDAHAGAGVEGSAHAGGGVHTDKIGGEDANISFGGEGYVEAEIAAKIEAAIKAKKGEISARLKAEAGVSAGIGGEVSADMELLGIPVTVKLAGEASVGAKVKGDVGIEYKEGKVRFIMEAGAVAGAGLEGKVVVEVGWDQILKLANEVGGKLIDKTLSTFTDYDPEFINKIANAPLLDDKIKLIIQREIDRNKRWKERGGDQLLQNVLGMIDNGADFAAVYRYIRSLMSDDYEGASRALEEIKEQIEEHKKEEEENDKGNAEEEKKEDDGGKGSKQEEDPFAIPLDGDENGQQCPVPGGGSNGTVKPKPSPNTRVRRGGGGDTKARIW